MYDIDLSIFHAIYSLAGRTPLLDWIIIFIAEYLPVLMVGAVVLWAFRDFRTGKRENFYGYVRAMVIAVVARISVAEIIRFFYHRPRPFLALNLPHLLTDSAYSFPSGHTIFLFGMATGVFFVNKRYGYWLFALSLLVGLGRVAAGVHYPSDILGGAILGIATGYAVHAVWKIRSKDRIDSHAI